MRYFRQFLREAVVGKGRFEGLRVRWVIVVPENNFPVERKGESKRIKSPNYLTAKSNRKLPEKNDSIIYAVL